MNQLIKTGEGILTKIENTYYYNTESLTEERLKSFLRDTYKEFKKEYPYSADFDIEELIKWLFEE